LMTPVTLRVRQRLVVSATLLASAPAPCVIDTVSDARSIPPD
jgi:hypothetical protein